MQLCFIKDTTCNYSGLRSTSSYAKDWLEQEEWENVAVDSQKFSHYTTLDKLLEEYVKVYLKNKLKEIDRNTRLEILMKKKYELIDYFMIF